MNLLLIDNYDSFTFNLYQMLSQTGAEVTVRLNDQVSAQDVALAQAVVFSPGPGNPDEAGQCLSIIREYARVKPMLGVCLGHQALAQAFGGRVVRAPRPMHGKQSKLYHDARGIYAGLQAPLTVGRYHSLIVEEQSLPREFEIASYTRDGEIMGIRHRHLPLEGVQFHPESILTEGGAAMLGNFVASWT
ncbi:aminodeoxychorismate/anthranilate synthase component II [bacterium]|nr:MAG: aminodeoxychorismate/anthranilate synthase component II [bacterium]RIK62337.1 MAG: anthranilate/aminodeoxychorismate synthase component II [Planctomycetota bacterium]